MAASAATTYRIKLPAPHQGQRVVLNALARPDIRFAWLDAGRRWEKTTLDMIFALDGAVRGEEVMWGAPVYDQVRTGFEYTKYACSEHPRVRFNESRMEANFPGGGVIRWRSLDDPDNARSKTAHRAIIDEAAKVKPEAFYEVIRPILISTQGKALLTFTPNGRNWTWREHVTAELGETPNSIAWRVPTLGATITADKQLVRQPHPMENPRVPWEEIVHMWRTLPERTFRQEILAEFLDDAGGVFTGVRQILAPYQFAERHWHPGTGSFAMGIDLAKSQDFTVVVVLDLVANRVIALERWNRESWPLQKARIAALSTVWGHPRIYLDATGLGDPIYDDLVRAGLHVEAVKLTAPAKEALIENAVLLVEQQVVRVPDPAVEPRAAVLVSELEAYEYGERTPSGRQSMGAPAGMHDDCVIAFALACWALSTTVGGVSALPDEVLSLLLQPVAGSDWLMPGSSATGGFGGSDFLDRKL